MRSLKEGFKRYIIYLDKRLYCDIKKRFIENFTTSKYIIDIVLINAVSFLYHVYIRWLLFLDYDENTYTSKFIA